MATSTHERRSTVIPALRYRDAAAAIEWLRTVFGFERKSVHKDAEGRVVHAELTLDGGMIMLGSDQENEYGQHVCHPDEAGGRSTQSPYVVVADADAVHARAVAAGAAIVCPLREESYGGKGFGCRDLEGHLWYVGTYNPWDTP